MNEVTRIGIILLAGLGAAPLLVVLVVVATPLPWWSGLILVPVLDAWLILWARRRLKKGAR